MFELTFRADTLTELRVKIREFIDSFAVPAEVTVLPERTEIKPVLTQEQMAENIANAPKHELPPQPTEAEVRKALNALREVKGTGAVKEILEAYGARNFQELQEGDYLGAMERAKAVM